MMTAIKIKEEVNLQKDSGRAKAMQRFFKTDPGEYGEGDVFAGLSNPSCRLISKKYKNIELSEVQELLNSKIHEERLIGLIILTLKANKADDELMKQLYVFYLANTGRINNWDLVDLSAPNIVGKYLFDKDREPLYKLADSDDLWEKRISVLSTFYFIRKNDFKDALLIIKKLLKDKHDLIHKANGWMLREIGKKDGSTLENFLKENYKNIPRTTLRYAIEKYPEEKRKSILKGKF